MLLAPADFDAIDRTVATVHQQLKGLGLTVEIETDLPACAASSMPRARSPTRPSTPAHNRIGSA